MASSAVLLRTVREYNERLEYVHLKPVKAGLVSRAEDWPWSSVHDYTGSVNRVPATPRKANPKVRAATSHKRG